MRYLTLPLLCALAACQNPPLPKAPAAGPPLEVERVTLISTRTVGSTLLSERRWVSRGKGGSYETFTRPTMPGVMLELEDRSGKVWQHFTMTMAASQLKAGEELCMVRRQETVEEVIFWKEDELAAQCLAQGGRLPRLDAITDERPASQ